MTLPAHLGLPWAARLFAACALATGLAMAVHAAEPPGSTVRVSGNVGNPLTLGVDELARMTVRQFEDARQVRVDGAHAAGNDPVRRYRGVLLRDVLEAAKPVERHRHSLRQSVVVVTAADGYRAVFSWAELYLSPIGEGAAVIFERDGALLSPNEGPLAVVSLRDLKPGPRHVKWLATIELVQARE